METNRELALTPKQLTAPRTVLLTAWGMLLALILLFGRDIRAWAENTEAGSLRSRFQPAAAQVAGISAATGISAFRQGLDGCEHRLYDAPLMCGLRVDEVMTSHAPDLPPAPRAAQINASLQRPQAGPAPAVQAAAYRPARILIVGASSIQESLGIELERRIEQYEGITVLRFGRYSSGLARPDYFDWTDKLTELKKEFKPDLIMAQWGGNDCQGISDKSGAFIAKFGTEEWDKAYAQRVTEIVKLMQDGGCHAVMIGMPAMRDKSFNNKIKRLDKVCEEATLAAGGVFLSTIDLTTDANGKYLDQVEFQGRKRLMRVGDGIHFSDHGAAFMGDALCQKLSKYFTLVVKK